MSKIKTEKQTTWTKFWSWYERHVTESLILTAFIIYIQIPHVVWNADLYLESGMISRVHPILDFFMYGVDLIEIFPMINIGFLIYSTIRKKRKSIKDWNITKDEFSQIFKKSAVKRTKYEGLKRNIKLVKE